MRLRRSYWFKKYSFLLIKLLKILRDILTFRRDKNAETNSFIDGF